MSDDAIAKTLIEMLAVQLAFFQRRHTDRGTHRCLTGEYCGYAEDRYGLWRGHSPRCEEIAYALNEAATFLGYDDAEAFRKPLPKRRQARPKTEEAQLGFPS